MKKKVVTGVIGVIICVGIFLGNAKTLAMSISPLRHTVIVDPGKSETVFVEVMNDTEKELTVFPEVDAFELDPETGAVKFGKADEAKSWIQADANSLSIAPEKNQRMNFLITVPTSTEPGSHYLALFVKEKSGGGQVGIGARVGTLLFLHVAGEVKEKLYVQDFSFGRSWSTKLPIELFLQFNNEGSIHVVPVGKIDITNFRGDVIETLYINQEKRKVLPGETWKEKFEVKNITWKDIGLIHANMETQYGVTKQMAFADERFWYFPTWLLTIVGVFALSMVGGIFLGIKKLRRR